MGRVLEVSSATLQMSKAHDDVLNSDTSVFLCKTYGKAIYAELKRPERETEHSSYFAVVWNMWSLIPRHIVSRRGV